MIEPGFDQAYSAEEWMAWFKAFLVPESMGEEVISAYLHHFADLGLLKAEEGGYRYCGHGQTELDAEAVRRDLAALAEGGHGFAVKYFLGQGNLDLAAALKEAEAAAGPEECTTGPEPASDLSNLQIVKKVGRQLRPFLDLEREALALLQGPCTSKADAQKIFHYLLSQTQMKAPARKWEQLSRKRHR